MLADGPKSTKSKKELMMDTNNEPILQVRHLKKYFPIRKGGIFSRETLVVKAVDDVSFDVSRGKTLGLVGETGSGKTTVGRTIIHLYEPTDGQIIFDGTDITHFNEEQMQKVRKEIQMIFQDPYASLDPRLTVEEIVTEPMEIHNLYTPEERRKRARELLNIVGLSPEHLNRFPHEFSGGQRQRIGLARALAVEPKFIICDEPVSALDVSIQAQIINTFEDMQEKFGLTYLFISHDIAMVKHISENIAVMYLGKIMENAPSSEIYKHPLHPYTQGLMAAVPIPDPKIEKKRTKVTLQGDISSNINLPTGCRFRPRCPYAMKICEEVEPDLIEVEKDHSVACHLYNKK
jgi:oligopeptide transport system ATP-binding protein